MVMEGSKPIRFIIPIVRLAESAAMLELIHTMLPTATLTMIMATLICVGSMV
jgi:hypothetical protein